jgi:hypothetical protein
MDIGMLLHVRLLVEAFPAVLAGVGPRVTVDEEVRGEGGRALERLPALLALERALLVVDGAVLAEADRVAEGLLAHVALVGPLAGVGATHVHLGERGRGEGQ